MREKYESLQLVQLKELAKARGLKGVSIMKKAALIELMLAEDEKEKSKTESEKPSPAKEEAPKSAAPAREEAPKAAAPAREEGTKPAQNRTVVKVNQEFQRKPESRISFVRNESQSASRVEGGSNRYEASGNGNYIRNNNYASNSGNYNNYKKNDNSRTDNAARDNRNDMRSDNSEAVEERQQRAVYRPQEAYDESQYPKELDSGVEASGILEVMPDGYGFIRCENYMPGENDVYVAPSQIRRFGLKTGDILKGNKRIKTQQEKFSALLFVRSINGYTVEEASRRMNFEDMTPIFPNERINLETPGSSVAMRVMDLVSPVGKGQRGMIVSPPKAGKTTLLKEVAKSILRTNPRMHMLILLIDERPEEVTDIREAIQGENVEVIYSTFDELPEHHKRVSEMVIERAKRLVEHKKDVVILIDSITRLTRTYNQVVPPSGRTLSGGLDPSALHMPKRFFGAARNMREGGSLTILATALVDTGSKMDDVVYEEFKGTGNMEMILDRKLSEKRIFPAIDLQKSGTRREDLLLDADELEAINIMRKALNGLKPDEATDKILDMFSRTRNNKEFVSLVKKNRFL
ncbi:MAG: transcription termination factor Rho [Lachnospiraceae bacterium]|nr:transcription termination factor Rho [Lachnospiraceae bacterium]